ncbi:MAG TPA: GMC family oxidoreductase, partial [Jatrophihabitantaceae bacterium]|nr:GMC family oxidoreductase [Jatrophihabitantaceae bacterium]
MTLPLEPLPPGQLWARADPAPWAVSDEIVDADVVVVGSGAGGATAAWALRNSGARVLLLEQGDWLPRELQNWEPKAVFGERRYKVTVQWVDDLTGDVFRPGLHDVVGGNTKVFGAAFPRFRESDFDAVEHVDGTSPAWPLSYADLEPYYEQAEQLFGVRGDDADDPSAPPRRHRLPYPPIPHEPYIADLTERLRAQGLHPSPVPLGIDLGPGGTCLRCRTCDGYPCMVGAKNDAERAAVRPALTSPTVRLLRNTQVQRIEVGTGGRAVVGLSCLHHGAALKVRSPRIVLACGSARTALLLLRSTSTEHERGLGNRTDQVGRNYMQHVNSALLAIDPRRTNPVFFQKTVQINDWYGRGGDGTAYPWGNVQALGKLQADHLKPSRPRVPRLVLDQMAK